MIIQKYRIKYAYILWTLYCTHAYYDIYIYTHQDIHMIIIDPYRKHIMIQMIKNHIIDMISRHP